MKPRIFIQFLALLAMSLGAFAQDENQAPPAPAEPPESPAERPAPETPEPAPEPETPAPEPEPEIPAEAPAPEPASPPVPPPAPAAPPAVPPAVTPPIPSPAEPAPLPAPPDVSAPPAEAEKSDSGLAWTVLQPGTGTTNPGPTDIVTVHYTGWKSSDGEMFDSSVQSGKPSSFPLDGVIEGWTEGLQLMVEGEKRRFWIPADLAYGEDTGGGRPGGMLCFDVELLDILLPPPIPAPDDAEVTPTGLATMVMESGTGPATPEPLDNVQVHYSYWTSDGKLGETTLTRGRPTTLPLRRTVPGFTEAVQMMVEGETRRMWIPAALAYGEQPPENAPKGMLVFEVELVKIIKTAAPAPGPTQSPSPTPPPSPPTP